MIPFLNSDQIKKADAHTIATEPVASIDLMERASQAFSKQFAKLYPNSTLIYVVCGTGNNGGDGLAIARILAEQDYQIKLFFIGDLERASEDFQVNYSRLVQKLEINHIKEANSIPDFSFDAVIIDAFFGSGLNRKITGIAAVVVQKINTSGSQVCSVDMPSGLMMDQPMDSEIIVRANHTISFQFPKLALMQPSLHQYVGEWHLVDIGLNIDCFDSQDFQKFLTEERDIVIPKRGRFDHKGKAGHLLLMAGSKGKMGAALLAARAANWAGCGLLTVHGPGCGLNILQVGLPEAMYNPDPSGDLISRLPNIESYKAIAIGPGIGTSKEAVQLLRQLLSEAKCPLVLDADAINIISENRELIDLLPFESILTPHPGEFRRLVGDWKNDFEKLVLLRDFCIKQKVNLVLKGAFSAVCDSHGNIYFNPTGNPGMATGGSGDVLTGIIGSLLSQGLSPFEALRTGVYIHGSAGDFAAQHKGHISMIASDLVFYLSSAFLDMSNVKGG